MENTIRHDIVKKFIANEFYSHYVVGQSSNIIGRFKYPDYINTCGEIAIDKNGYVELFLHNNKVSYQGRYDIYPIESTYSLEIDTFVKNGKYDINTFMNTIKLDYQLFPNLCEKYNLIEKQLNDSMQREQLESFIPTIQTKLQLLSITNNIENYKKYIDEYTKTIYQQIMCDATEGKTHTIAEINLSSKNKKEILIIVLEIKNKLQNLFIDSTITHSIKPWTNSNENKEIVLPKIEYIGYIEIDWNIL